MIAYIPLIIALIGLLLYALAANPKIAEAGRLAYFAGLFVTLLSVAHKTVSILAR